jgi:hypothetical protein
MSMMYFGTGSMASLAEGMTLLYPLDDSLPLFS